MNAFYTTQQTDANNSYYGQMEYNPEQLFQPMGYLPLYPDNILEGFCLCEIKKGLNCVSQAYQFSKGAKCIETYDFYEQIEKLIKLISPKIGSVTYFTIGKKKSQACKSKIVSKRRSIYTGVTKNSSNYQTLIVINGKKIYVGSFTKEILAAITFDFYSILLHLEKATTNFSYTADEIMAMIENYRVHGNKFDPYDYYGQRQ